MSIKLIFISVILLLVPDMAMGGNPSSRDTVKILWVGSSSTYVHDLPRQTAEWLESHFAPRPVRSCLVGRSGTGFHEYLEPGFEAQYGLKEGQTLLEKIRDGDYDYVVLQMITYFIGADLKQETEKSTDILCAAIREAGAEPVYYEMGWRKGPENEIGRKLITASGRRNFIKYYGPCSSAWKEVRAEIPNIELHNLPDNVHPGTLGTYLNLCCMYAAIAGEKAENPPNRIEVWPRFGAFDEQEAAEKLKNRKLDDYHAAMPGWMQRISVMRTEQAIDAKITGYLNEVACQQWKKHMEQIK